NCQRKALYVPDVEAAVEEYYRRIQIPEHTIAALRSFITAQFSQLHATVQQERNAHVLERDDLQAERSKLLQAHYAGAVPLDLLKSEQDRLGRRIAFLEAQIEAGDMEYELASEIGRASCRGRGEGRGVRGWGSGEGR